MFGSNYPELKTVDPRYRRDIHMQHVAEANDPVTYSYDAYDPEENPDPNRKVWSYKYGMFVLDDAYYKNKAPGEAVEDEAGEGQAEQEGQPVEQQPVPGPSVYGQYRGQPIHGPAGWEHFYRNWISVGFTHNYAPDVPFGPPLTQSELDFCRKYGFEFDMTTSLGEGGFGVVLVCNWHTFDHWSGGAKTRTLACKIMDIRAYGQVQGFHTTPQQAVEKVLNEVTLLKECDHPNLVKVEYMFSVHHQQSGFPFFKTCSWNCAKATS